jgi:hypothetical protein
MFLPCISTERRYAVSFFPKFRNEPLCTNSDTPDDWFPEFDDIGGERKGIVHTGNCVGTVACNSVDILCHARSSMRNTFGGAMSDLHTYRVKAKCMVSVYQDITCDDVERAVYLALDAVNEWNVYSLDEAEVKRVLEVERID